MCFSWNQRTACHWQHASSQDVVVYSHYRRVYGRFVSGSRRLRGDGGRTSFRPSQRASSAYVSDFRRRGSAFAGAQFVAGAANGVHCSHGIRASTNPSPSSASPTGISACVTSSVQVQIHVEVEGEVEGGCKPRSSTHFDIIRR